MELRHPAKNYYFGISTGYVIKQLVHAFSCTYIELWVHLGSLESTQEAAPRATLTLLSCSPNFPRASITRCTHAKHEPIVKSSNTDIKWGWKAYATPTSSRLCSPRLISVF